MPTLLSKPGVLFTVIAPAGFQIMAALTRTAFIINHDLEITSACDGEHSGPDDPHHRGEAYDVRTHDLPDKYLALATVKSLLDDAKFFAWIEDEGLDNEHMHVQLRHGAAYP